VYEHTEVSSFSNVCIELLQFFTGKRSEKNIEVDLIFLHRHERFIEISLIWWNVYQQITSHSSFVKRIPTAGMTDRQIIGRMIDAERRKNFFNHCQSAWWKYVFPELRKKNICEEEVHVFFSFAGFYLLN
jgi:hypothetical protein